MAQFFKFSGSYYNEMLEKKTVKMAAIDHRTVAEYIADSARRMHLGSLIVVIERDTKEKRTYALDENRRPVYRF